MAPNSKPSIFGFGRRGGRAAASVLPNPVIDSSGQTRANGLAFSGGGFNSFSTLAGLLSGMMQASGQSINDLLKLQGTISGNSGGTWFLSCLAYSQPFVESLLQIQSANGVESYPYNQQIRSIFTNQSLLNQTSQETLAKFLNALGLSDTTNQLISKEIPYLAGLLANNLDIKWEDFVSNTVYAPAVLGGKQLRDINLDSPRLSWAAKKDLVYALAAASTPAVINDRGPLTLNEKNFALIQPSPITTEPWWYSYQKATRKNLSALPLLVNSDYNSKTQSINASARFPFGTATINYKNNPLLFQSKLSVPIGQTFALSGFNLINTTTASSATYGQYASPDSFVKDGPANTDGFDIYNQASTVLRKLAPLASFKNGNLSNASETDTGTQSLNGIANAGLARLVDGGFVDNTSVAYITNHLQKSNGTQKPFKIGLLMNSTLDPVTGYATFSNNAGKTFAMAGSVMCLFGLDYSGKPLLNQAVPADSSAPTFATPSPQVFKLDAWDAITGPSWSYRADNGTFSIDVYKLKVETVQNQAMGVAAGQKGELVIVASNNSQSAAGPMKPEILDEYDQNFTYARDAMIKGGGWQVLQDLFTVA